MVPTAHCENGSVKYPKTKGKPSLNCLITQCWHYPNTTCPCRCNVLQQKKTLETVRTLTPRREEAEESWISLENSSWMEVLNCCLCSNFCS
ncbi:hypothetical protein Y032_0213g2305 [Ancylostoma ceylanicum]|uniref:Uncharacterized protein n=1 Tax=Ancylostoma ceylanicum TaxID=53326 RepID=A0A016SJJ0_9BILA|nr:hypothetical protein Y032_0213g2305 [Ancylostoma ceylanicum]